LTTGPLDHSTTLLRIYDQAGRVVREFPGLDVKRGMYSVTWDGRDAKGSTLASGIYFVRLKSGDYAATEKLVLQR
jgi:flagellar hook assembly protein FlgD